MKKYISIAILSFLLLSIFSLKVSAQTAPPKLDYSGFVKCDGVVKKDGSEPNRDVKCDFNAFMNTINKAINWMFYISIPLAATLFAWAGLLYIRGTSASRSQANKVFTTVGLGFIIMLVAWIGVRTVVGWLVTANSSATTFLGK